MSGNVVRGSTLGILGQAVHLLTAFALYAFLARRFGPALFGDWRVTITVLGWFEVFIVAGIAKVATKAISQSPKRSASIGWASYAGQAGVGLVAAAALVVLAPALALALGDPSLTWMLRVAAFDIPVFALFMAASGIVLGLKRFERQAVGWSVYALAKAVFVAALAVGPLSVTGALIGNALASLVGLAAVFLPLRRTDAEKSAGLSRSIRELASPAIPFVALALLLELSLYLDLWLVSARVGESGPVGLYAAAAIIAEVPVFLFIGLNRVIFPSVASAHACGDVEQESAYITLGVRIALVITALAVAFVAVAGSQSLALIFSAQYSAANLTLTLLMIAGMARTIVAVCSDALLAQDRRRAALALAAVTVVAVGVAAAAGITFWGATGAAAGTAVAVAATAIGGLFVLRDVLGRHALVTFARVTVAAVLACAPIAFLHPSPVLLVPAAVVTLVLYLALLRLFGELTKADLAAMRDAARPSTATTPDVGGGNV